MSIPKLLYKLWVTVTGINILSLKSIGQFDRPKLTIKVICINEVILFVETFRFLNKVISQKKRK